MVIFLKEGGIIVDAAGKTRGMDTLDTLWLLGRHPLVLFPWPHPIFRSSNTSSHWSSLLWLPAHSFSTAGRGQTPLVLGCLPWPRVGSLLALFSFLPGNCWSLQLYSPITSLSMLTPASQRTLKELKVDNVLTVWLAWGHRILLKIKPRSSGCWSGPFLDCFS